MRPIDDLARLVAYESVSSRPLDGLAAFVAQRCEDLGFHVDTYRDPRSEGKCSLVATIGPQGTDGLVLTGHMDVVPTEGQPWSSDPFVLDEREGRLYGRGTADMKGFFVATLHALARIQPKEYRRELALVWTHDEEVGCLGSAWLVDEISKQGRALPSACLVGEPTDFQILRMHPGHVAVELTVRGQAAHSSRPDLGLNAIEGAARLVEMAKGVAAQLEKETLPIPELERPWVTFNVGRIHGGTAVNIVPDHCEIELGYRPLPGMEPEAVYARLKEAVPADLKSRTEVRLVRVTPSLLTPEGTPLQHVLSDHARHEHCGAATFATDGGNLAKLGMKPLVFGPGSINVAHQADEYLEHQALLDAIDIIEDVVRRQCCLPQSAP